MVLVGYDQEQHHSFRDFDDCEELWYLTLLVPLSSAGWSLNTRFLILDWERGLIYSHLASSCSLTYFMSWGCIALIVINRVCTAESFAIDLPRWEFDLIRFTNISKELFNALRNCWSSLTSPFWNFYQLKIKIPTLNKITMCTKPWLNFLKRF